MNVLRNGKIRRTATEWRTVFQQFARSGLAAPAFCKRESITLSSFRRWQKKLGADQGESVTDSEKFVEVTPAAGPAAFWALEVELPDGRVLRMRG